VAYVDVLPAEWPARARMERTWPYVYCPKNIFPMVVDYLFSKVGLENAIIYPIEVYQMQGNLKFLYFAV
jgi:hypothetical protein